MEIVLHTVNYHAIFIKKEFDENESIALSVVSYTGATISIVSLVITIIILITLRLALPLVKTIYLLIHVIKYRIDVFVMYIDICICDLIV